MKALIAAGGRATRLRPITHTTNKHLIPIAGRPLIFLAIEKIAEAGIKEIAINVNPGETELMRQVIGDGSRWGVHISYLEQNGGPCGLAHVVANAKDWVGNEPFVFYLGDNIVLGPIAPLVKRFESEHLDCMLALARVPDPRAFGCPVFENGSIVRVIEKPANPPSPYAVTGIYVYAPCVFDAIAELKPSARGEYEISDAHTWLIEHGKKVGYEEVTGWWKDTGKPDDLIDANALVLGLQKASAVSENAIIEPGTVVDGIVTIGEGTKVSKDAVIRGPVAIGKNCVIQNGATVGPNVSVSDNVEIDGARVDASILMDGARLCTPRRISRSIIGNRAAVLGTAVASAEGGDRFLVGDQSVVELV